MALEYVPAEQLVHVDEMLAPAGKAFSSNNAITEALQS
jgi:hypothetical protein